MPKCKGITQKGEHCRKTVRNGIFCYNHRDTREVTNNSYFNVVSELLTDDGLPKVISNLLCQFFILKPKNKKLDCSGEIILFIDNGKIICEGAYRMWIPKKNDFVSVSINSGCFTALRKNGTIECFGMISPTNSKFHSSTEGDFVYAAATNENVICIRSDDTIKTIKDGESKEKDFVMFVSSTYGESVVGLKHDGTLHYFGKNSGDALPTNSNIVSISLGNYHMIGLTLDGTLISTLFSYNNGRSLVNNTPPGSDFIAIFAGENHSIALKECGIGYIWGEGYNGAAGFGFEKCTDIVLKDRTIIGMTPDGNIVRKEL